MPEPSDAHKAEAREVEAQFRRLRNAAAAVVAGIGFLDPTAVAYLVATALIGFLAEDQAIVNGRIAADPPRKDYDTATRLRGPVVDVHALGRAPFAVAAGDAIAALDQAAARLEAMIRAIERAQGATLSKAFEERDRRVEEAFELAGDAGEALTRFETAGVYLAERIEDAETREPSMRVAESTTSKRRKARFEDVLPDPALAILYRSGLPIGRLRAPLAPPQEIPQQPMLGLSYNLRSAALKAGSYGGELRRGRKAFELDE